MFIHNDGSVKEYKATGLFVVGLAEEHWYPLTRYKDYRLHSRPDNPDNGAWVIEGTHYIHSGPTGVNEFRIRKRRLRRNIRKQGVHSFRRCFDEL